MIEIRDLTIRQGEFTLERVNMIIPDGRYAVLMGSSGSGKTTILECVLGLRQPSSGQILLGGEDVTQRKPAERGIGYVPQDRAIFPTMTIGQQIAFPLVLRKRPEEEIRARVAELGRIMDIEAIMGRKPQGLSGGEAQRVALARALAHDPQLLCLDEPLSALDAELHDDMCTLLKKVQHDLGVTTLHITHHYVEVEKLADVVFRIDAGKVQREDRRQGDGTE